MAGGSFVLLRISGYRARAFRDSIASETDGRSEGASERQLPTSASNSGGELFVAAVVRDIERYLAGSDPFLLLLIFGFRGAVQEVVSGGFRRYPAPRTVEIMEGSPGRSSLFLR